MCVCARACTRRVWETGFGDAIFGKCDKKYGVSKKAIFLENISPATELSAVTRAPLTLCLAAPGPSLGHVLTLSNGECAFVHMRHIVDIYHQLPAIALASWTQTQTQRHLFKQDYRKSKWLLV